MKSLLQTSRTLTQSEVESDPRGVSKAPLGVHLTLCVRSSCPSLGYSSRDYLLFSGSLKLYSHDERGAQVEASNEKLNKATGSGPAYYICSPSPVRAHAVRMYCGFLNKFVRSRDHVAIWKGKQ